MYKDTTANPDCLNTDQLMAKLYGWKLKPSRRVNQKAACAMTSAPPLLILASGGKPRLRRVRIPVPSELSLHIPVEKRA